MDPVGNNPLRPRVTRQRLSAALIIFAIASGIMFSAGVDMISYLTGVALGVAIVGALAWHLSRKSR